MKLQIGIDNHPADSRVTLSQDGIIQTLSSRMGTGGGNVPMLLEQDTERKEMSKTIVRRLTPLECERLQGYPDNWTLIGEKVETKVVEDPIWGTYEEDIYEYVDPISGKKKKVCDSARYKALGNSIALPQWWWLTCKMAKHLPKNATLGSLFDGIGGFPLVWETKFGEGTARWASEIEDFPIAVTTYRFPEKGEKNDT